MQYYGLIKQATGEDWDNAKISLSTAQPSIGGSAPTLPTRIIRFKPPAQVRYYARSRGVGAAASFHDDYDRTGEYDPTIEDSYMGDVMLCLDSYEFQKSSTKMKKRGRGRRSSFSPPPSPPALDVEVAQVIGLFQCRRHSCMYQQL